MLRTGALHIAKVAAVSLLVAGSMVTGISPAQAYDGDPYATNYALVDTGNCNRLGGGFGVVHGGSYCWVNDALDGTYLERDPGGRALNFTMWFAGSEPDIKVEWHPYGEHLWVYDVERDSDTVYVELIVDGVSQGLFRAPPQGSSRNYRDYNLSFAEGADVALRFWDNSNGTDLILSTLYGMKA